jgi:hypothetical protein
MGGRERGRERWGEGDKRGGYIIARDNTGQWYYSGGIIVRRQQREG